MYRYRLVRADEVQEPLYSHDFKLGLRWAYDQPSYYPPVVY